MRSIRVLLAVAVIASGVVPAAAELPDLSTRAGEDWGAFLGPTGNGRSAGTGIATPWPAAGPRAAPVIHGDRVLTFGPEGRLECRSLADGSSLWSVDTTAEYHVVQNFFGVGAAPLVVRVGSDELFSAIAASPVAVGDDVLLAECYGPGSVLLDLADGDPRVVRRDRNPRPRSALMPIGRRRSCTTATSTARAAATRAMRWPCAWRGRPEPCSGASRASDGRAWCSSTGTS